MGASESEKTNRMHDTLYGPPGKPEESLMVQLVNAVKELKRLRVDHDNRMDEYEAMQAKQEGMQAEISGNSRTNRNLTRLMWLVVSLIIAEIYTMIPH